MTDIPLLTMALAMNAAYSVTPTWQNADKTAHVIHTTVTNPATGEAINTFAWLGTIDIQEWLEDDFSLRTQTDLLLGPVHLKSLQNAVAIAPFIEAKLADLGWPPYYVVGHSKGAREAPLFTARAKLQGHPPLCTYLFEPPFVGGQSFVNWLADQPIWATQTFNAGGPDFITKLPLGDGWMQVREFTPVKVPDSLDEVGKHKMVGVIAGLTD